MSSFLINSLIAFKPPGYIGFDQGGLLTDGIRKHPHSVLLLDEIDVLDLKQQTKTGRFAGVDLIISCGDLPPEYLTSLVDAIGAPLYYVGGNHDLLGQTLQEAWADRHGPTYYHFVYRDVLFLVLDESLELRRQTVGLNALAERLHRLATVATIT